MEDIQKKQNEYVTIDEFNKLHFGQGGELPILVLDFVSTLTGVAREYLIRVLTQNINAGSSTSKLQRLQTINSDKSSHQQLNRADSTA
jgi:hypothetical protein